MAVFRRGGFKLLWFLLAAGLIAGVALILTFKSAKFKNWAQTELSERTGYDIRLTELGLELPWSIIVGELEVSKPGQFHLAAGRLAVTLTPLDLIAKTAYRMEIDRPLLRVDLQSFANSSTQTKTDMAIRRLNVRDGVIVLTNGEHTVVELPNLNVNAENLNLGEPSGISLRADVPALDGKAELRLKGSPRELESELVVRANGSGGEFSRQSDKTSDAEILRLTAKLTAPENQRAAIAIESQFHKFPTGGPRVTGMLNGRAEVDAKLTAVNFAGRAELTGFPNDLNAVMRQLPGGAVAANFAGVFSLPAKTLSVKSLQFSSHLGHGSGTVEALFHTQPTITSAKIDLADLPLEALKALLPAPANKWNYNGRGEVDLTLRGPWNSLQIKGVARSADATVRGDGFAASKLSLTAPFEWSDSALLVSDSKMQATQIAYSEKERWQSTAERVEASASLEYKPAEPMKISGRIDVGGGKFSSPDSTKIGENLTFRGPFELILDATKSKASLVGTFSAGTGELLWGKFFGDLKSQSPALEVTADYQRDMDRLELRRAILRLTRIGNVEVSGVIERVFQAPTLRLQVRSGDFLPGGFFDFFLRDTFSRQYPLLEKLTINGRMSFQAQLRGALEALAAEGELSLQAGELRAKANDWQIGPIALVLPFQIDLADIKQPSSTAATSGTLVIERARFAGQSVAPIKTTISLSNNSLRFLQPLTVKLFGGEIVIGQLVWPNLLHDPRRVSFSADLKRLQLDAMTETLNWPRFSGILTGSIPEVQSVDHLLRTRGEIQAEVFGGRVSVGKLEVEEPFSSLASIRLDAKVDGIELEQLSKTFAFGRISGILEGSVQDLVITDGQPAEMRADFRSVDRGAEQRISVEALDKITVLSSGESAGALYSGLAGLFDSFRYSKLGFKATLKNDRLTLRGVESDGNKELLVVGSLIPPTVNIISHTQNIAFSELMRRLERIKSDKPVVK